MTISERRLREWRKSALKTKPQLKLTDPIEHIIDELCDRVLLLTQELIDQHLLRK